MKRALISTATKCHWITWLGIPEKILLVILLVASVCASATELNNQYPRLHMDETDYENACHPSELERLRLEVLELAAGRAPEDVWQLISTLLCTSLNNAKIERMLKAHLPKKIRFDFYGTGDSAKTVKLITPNVLDLMVKRKAWNARIDGYGRADMHLSYWSDEACMGGLDFQFNGQSWLIVGTGGACD